MFIFSKGLPRTVNLIKDIPTKYKSNQSRKITHRLPNGKIRVCTNLKRTDTYTRGNIWDYSVGYQKTTTDKYAYAHPAMFPEALARDHIVSWSNVGDWILDPFMGSGTTGKMALKKGRFFVGCEINENYYNIALKRVRKELRGLF